MEVIVSEITRMWLLILNIAKDFKFKDAIDIIVVAAVIYQAVKLMRDSRAGQLIKGVAFIIVARAISSYFGLILLSAIMEFFFEYGFFSLIILFQPEIRKALEKVGRSNVRRSILGVVIGRESSEKRAALIQAIDAVVDGAAMLQQMRMGALIVFERETRLDEVTATGTIVDAEPNAQMIGNIFYNKAPLHDGALLIRAGRLYAAGCILPLTANSNVSAALGTRHRAALGISEDSDAVAVVVSEETGQISIAVKGRLERNLTRANLGELLKENLLLTEDKKETANNNGKMKNSSTKKGGVDDEQK